MKLKKNYSLLQTPINKEYTSIQVYKHKKPRVR